MVRKAIKMSSVILDIKEFTQVDESSTIPLTRFEISQSTSSGLPGTSEKRYLDWEDRTQEDHIFGKCAVRARWVGDSKNVNGRILPVFDLQTTLVQDDSTAKFLAGEINGDLSPSEGFLVERPKEVMTIGDGLWLQLFIRHLEGKWTAEQVCFYVLPSKVDSALFRCYKADYIANLGVRDDRRGASLHPTRCCCQRE